ncbi:MAG: hypothetical protein CMO80_22390 [Verrucomicrobiales bacterium]|nr:hypothetical protein [Verrucomicrobiales bacterium]|tara:strand:+ start:7667 stop:8131 length:465 start_codon:yes stop_codon:yes gene_type:complete
MSNETTTKLIFYPVLLILTLVRKPVFWIIVVLLLGFWLMRGQQQVEQSQDNETAMNAIIEQSIPVIPKSKPEAQIPSIPGVAKKGGQDTESEEFTFPPEFTEAVSAKFRMAKGREPKDWDDFVSAGVVDKVPPAPKGFRYVYDAELGLMEMIRE